MKPSAVTPVTRWVAAGFLRLLGVNDKGYCQTVLFRVYYD
jgi:hypothetical protein